MRLTKRIRLLALAKRFGLLLASLRFTLDTLTRQMEPPHGWLIMAGRCFPLIGKFARPFNRIVDQFAW